MEKTAIELFAGVGGFRVGLNHVSSFDEKGKAVENGNFHFLWANQWEPSTKIQHAYDCYNKRFASSSSENSNVDISKVNKKDIPDHSLLCGGFPCQDYSVAHSLSKEKGIEGKKGVLWWQIRDILIAKKTPFVFLENVDRLIKSPAKQRGRDFGIMLRCLADLGYAVEWRVINAAEYGLPQRRRRTYIFAYRKNTAFYKQIKKSKAENVFLSKGIFARAFPISDKADGQLYQHVSKNMENNAAKIISYMSSVDKKAETAQETTDRNELKKSLSNGIKDAYSDGRYFESETNASIEPAKNIEKAIKALTDIDIPSIKQLSDEAKKDLTDKINLLKTKIKELEDAE